ncbi:hypothetical protein K1719_000679 [Acacia pycnantha]|nr:hypothetical protein K1719_000679 [Acacia pycnantha]
MSSFSSPRFLLSCVTLSLFLHSPSYSITDDYYTACSTLFNCGKIRNVGFPFWGQGRPEGCGYPELCLNCSEDLTFITIRSVTYLVLDANPDQHILRIVRFDYKQNLCPNQLLNTSLDPHLFENMPETRNLTLLYGCPVIPSVNTLQFPCLKNGFDNPFGYVVWDNTPNISVLCSTSVVVPVEAPTSSLELLQVSSRVIGMLNYGFQIKWIAGIVECDNCQKSGGVCGYNWGSNKTTCYYIRSNPQPQPQENSGTSIT